MEVTVAVLAGGRGKRIGGDKALVQLGGRPLIAYPVAAARAAGLGTVVVAKSTTRLPDLDVPVLLEPDAPVHPLLGVITALEQLPAVIALPCDMPFVEPGSLAELAAAAAELAILAPGQPFPALYRRTMLPRLRSAVQAGDSVRSTQARSFVAHVADAPTPQAAMTVNTAADLAEAERLLSER